MTAQVLEVFLFDSASGEYAGPYTAHESPLEPGIYLEPTSSTRLAPPAVDANETAVFSNGAWTVEADYRKASLYSTADGSARSVDKRGPLPAEMTDKPRPSEAHDWDGAGWSVNLDRLKAQAQRNIDAYYQVLYDQAVPNNAMKAEYDAAYTVAKRWLEAPVEPVPERIKALAESYGVTNDQAAGVVVQKWTEAQAVAFDLRGAARLRAKRAIRQAVDLEGVAAAELAGRAAMEAVTYTV